MSILKSTEYKFYVQVERMHYHCILPNEILLIILNQLYSVSLSLVNYQFYITNKDFVSKCYQLHRQIPILYNLIYCKNTKYSKNKSPNLCVIQINKINYNYEFNLHKFNNMSDAIQLYEQKLIYDCAQFNLFKAVCHIMAYDPYIYGELFKISHISTELVYDYTLVSELNDYLDVLKLFDTDRIKKIINILESFKNNNTSIVLLVHQLLSCFGKDEKTLVRVLNVICCKKHQMSFDRIIENISAGKVNEILSDMFNYSIDILINSCIDIRDKYYKLLNYQVSGDCLYFLNEYKKPLVQVSDCKISEYQWVADQLYK